jgi:hypothetical protein
MSIVIVDRYRLFKTVPIHDDLNGLGVAGQKVHFVFACQSYGYLLGLLKAGKRIISSWCVS